MIVSTDKASPHHEAATDRPRLLQGILNRMKNHPWRILALISGLWALAWWGLGWMQTVPVTSDLGIEIQWLPLAIGFYLAEVFVVHIQFRKDAHTLSMSEVPMVFGLLFAAPVALLVGQLVGSAAALILHRRQRPMKLAVNLGQLALQTVAAVAVFTAINGAGSSLDLRTLVAAVLAMLAALLVGHMAVLAAIRASGGRESIRETSKVFAVSSLGTIGAAMLAIVASIVAISAPEVWWVGFAPVLFVFIAYRAYVDQTRDKERVAALFDAATALHRSPQIERAVVAVAERVVDLVKSEAALVAVFGSDVEEAPYISLVGSEGAESVMEPRYGIDLELRSLARHKSASVLQSDDLAHLVTILGDGIEVRDAVSATLYIAGDPVGMLIGINRVGDVSAFDDNDVLVLATLGSQLSTSLENGRLSDSLSEIGVLKDQLEEMLASKDRLIASVSHELRTPLTGVIGLTSIVRDSAQGELDAENTMLLDMVVEQGAELSNIIDDLLTHARAEAGTLQVDSLKFNLTDEALTVAASHGVELPDVGVSVWALGDPMRMRQILRNLITNARRYGGPNVGVRVEADGENAAVLVVDDGSGVPEAEVKSIFEPYITAHQIGTQPGSVGLGLSVALSMARMMGGDLTHTRQDGVTIFKLSLPAVNAPTSAVPSVAVGT
jgi:signal transduction histidine kinase